SDSSDPFIGVLLYWPSFVPSLRDFATRVAFGSCFCFRTQPFFYRPFSASRFLFLPNLPTACALGCKLSSRRNGSVFLLLLLHSRASRPLHTFTNKSRTRRFAA